MNLIKIIRWKIFFLLLMLIGIIIVCILKIFEDLFCDLFMMIDKFFLLDVLLELINISFNIDGLEFMLGYLINGVSCYIKII